MISLRPNQWFFSRNMVPKHVSKYGPKYGSLAEISVRSPPKLFIFIIYRNILWMKVFKNNILFYFETRSIAARASIGQPFAGVCFEPSLCLITLVSLHLHQSAASVNQFCHVSRNIAYVTPHILYLYDQKYIYRVKVSQKRNLNFGKNFTGVNVCVCVSPHTDRCWCNSIENVKEQH